MSSKEYPISEKMTVENLNMDTANISTSVILNTIRPFAPIKNVVCLTVKKRHPRTCRYYKEFNRCKFTTYCLFKHETVSNTSELEKKIRKN
jgi:hypothetical protein